MTPRARPRVTVFGASGAIGALVVERLVANGHPVTVYVRDPAKLAVLDPAVRVMVGPIADAGAIRAAIAGSAAVISALGPSMDPRTKGHPLVAGTQHIVDGMLAEGVTRYVGMATPSVADPRDGSSLLGRVAPIAARTALPRAYRELVDLSAVVMESPLDWTILRFSRPTDAAPKRQVRLGFLGHDRVGLTVTRADIASTLVDQLTDDRFIRAAPVISN